MSELRTPLPTTLGGHLALLWKRRDLVVEFTRRDLKVRYRGSVLGVFWTLLNPLLTMAVFTLVFSHFFRQQVKNYPVFFLCGYLPWVFFSTSLVTATRALLDHGSLIKRMHFPHEVFAVSIAFGGLIHLALSLMLLFAFLFAFGVAPSATWLLLPIPIALELLLVVGIGLLVSIATVYLRDLEQLLPGVVVMLWFYVTPVIYPLVDDAGHAVIPERWVSYYLLNPMAGVVLAFRDVLLYGRVPDPRALLPAAIGGLLTLVVGYVLFKRWDRAVAEQL